MFTRLGLWRGIYFPRLCFSSLFQIFFEYTFAYVKKFCGTKKYENKATKIGVEYRAHNMHHKGHSSLLETDCNPASSSVRELFLFSSCFWGPKFFRRKKTLSQIFFGLLVRTSTCRKRTSSGMCEYSRAVFS